MKKWFYTVAREYNCDNDDNDEDKTDNAQKITTVSNNTLNCYEVLNKLIKW